MARGMMRERVKAAASTIGLILLWSVVAAGMLFAAGVILGLTRILYPIAVAIFFVALVLSLVFKRSKLPPVTFLGQMAFVVWGPIYVVGVSMPLRAAAVALMPDPLLAPFDVGVAVAGALVAVVVTVRDAAWRRRQLSQLENLPTSRVGAAAAGLVELRGVARAAAGSSKPGDVLIHGKLQPFAIEDDTGRLTVDPAGARFRPFWANAFEGRGCEVTLPKNTLRDGDPVYVIGSLETDPSGARVVKPRIETKTSFLWRTLFTYKEKEAEPQRDIQHVFFVSSHDERAARRHLLLGLRQILVLGGAWLVLSAALAALQLPRALSYDAWTVKEIAARAPRARRGELLLKRLKEGDRSERKEVLEEVQVFLHRDSLPVVLHALGDPDPALARKAADELNPDSYEQWTQLHLKAAPFHSPALEGVRRGLQSADARVRKVSTMVAGRISPATAAADLAPLLRDPAVEVRTAVAKALQDAGPAARNAIPSLDGALGDSEPSVKKAVLGALRRILEGDPRYATFFLDHLASPDPAVRAGSADALSRSGPGSAEALIALLDDPAPEVRRAAAYSLQWPGTGKPEATRALMRAGKDPDPAVRATAIRALENSNVRPESRDFVPLLVERLDDSAADVRRAAAKALKSLGPASAPAAARLGRALSDSDWYVRDDAGSSLTAVGSAAAAALPGLKEAMQHQDYRIRNGAVRLAGRLGPIAEPMVDLLGRALSDPESRHEAIQALGAMGPAGRAAVPALLKSLGDSPDLRSYVLSAIGSIGPAAAEAVPALLPMLDPEDGPHVEGTIRTLGCIGPAAKAAVPRLILFLEGRHESAARQALGSIGPGDASALAQLRARFAAASRWPRKVYGELLCAYGEDAADLFPAILDLTEDGYDGTFAAAFASGGRPALETSVARLQDPVVWRRTVACAMLERMGPRAAPALEALSARLEDPDQIIRARACDALAAIGPAAAPAAPRLLEIVRKNDVVEAALKALAAVGPGVMSTAPELVKILGPNRCDGTVRALLRLPKDGGLYPRAAEALESECPGSERAEVLARIVLSSQDGPALHSALEALATWTDMPERAAALILLATGREAKTKDAMFRALRDVDATGRTALRAAAGLFPKDDWHASNESAKILLAAGPDAAEVLPDLLAALAVERWSVAERAVEILGRIGLAARGAEERLLARLHETRGARWPVGLALARIGAGKSALPVVAEKARGSRGMEQEILSAAAARIEAGAPADAEPWTRERAVFAARRLQDLRSALRDPHPAVRFAAAQRLEEMEGPASEALPELETALSDSSIAVRVFAARSLARLGPAAAPAVPTLARSLSDPSDEAAGAAAWAISRTGPAARGALAEVLAAYRKRVPGAAAAIAAIGPDAAEAVPQLIRDLRPYPDVHVLEALGSMGAAARPAVPHLVIYLDHGTSSVRFHAADAIRRIGPAAAEAIPDLLRRLGRYNRDGIDPARRALGGIGEAAVPGLIEKLRKGNAQTRIAAAWTLREIGPPARAAVPVLIEILKGNETWLHHPAVGALGGIGPEARAAAPYLARIAARNDQAGMAAQEVLRRLRASK